MKWTDRQREAIETRNQNILVSAAAGSGKTAVLTERVKNILCDEEKGIYRTNKIIVTNPRTITDEMVLDLYKKTTLSDFLTIK